MIAQPGLLTVQERRALVCLAQGMTVAETAEHLGITTQTVKNHLGAAYRKLRVRNRSEAFFAMGWLTPPEPDS